MMDNQLKNDRVRKVCKKLFQDDDDDNNEQQKHCDIRESILEEMRIQAERDEKKWNFNFIHEKPLPGRYEWVGPNDEIPEENEISDFKETNERIQNDQEEYAEETKNNAENIYNKSNENDAERSN
ncbi:uncharacterized protein LOC105428305 [Pogonomyrmex barbatus]|uniref:Uncharacterized protein LOC105428305 n=1 Tax=Pogonomyrmex barbatus TaxID=144034 RepID=A0A6I9X366_9HYME|nr:uncharacterized protein LOC105428305 [Pogonomyrmex barbatus]